MKLKSLELFGFKSFVDKTAIHFEEGITAIVGPNGAGKSNCVDAIRWVMGEQSAKHLRGQEMQDVIFNGTTSRPPVGLAQVLMRFDLSDGLKPAGYGAAGYGAAGYGDYTEMEIERRLYRSGESDYYINKVPCRLRDIVDLFLGTGVGTKAYSIVEQGRIDQILSAKPEERRLIIEEAAGISKFKNRKAAALRKIESTEANLARLKDVIAELKRQLNSLNRQAKKAERYQQIFAELKQRELKFSAKRYAEWNLEKERLEADRVDCERKEIELAARLAADEASIETDRLGLTNLERELNEAQENFYRQQNALKWHETTLEYQTSKLKDLSRQLEFDAKEIEMTKRKLKECETEMGLFNEEKLKADFTVEQAKEKIQEVEAAVQSALTVCTEWQEKTEQTNRGILGLTGALAETQSQLEYLEKKDFELQGRIAKGQAEIDSIDKVLKELTKKIERSEQAFVEMKQLGFRLVDETTQLKEHLESRRQDLEQQTDQLESLKGDLAAKTSRLHSFQEIHKNMEGFSQGVRQVLQAADRDLSGIHGAVGDMLETQAEYEPAVSAVLGEKLQYVVVQSQQAGLEAIAYLKEQAVGRSTFIPMDIQVSEEKETPRGTLAGDGVVGPLLEKVRFKDDCRNIAQYLFGDCLLVEDLSKALHLWTDGVRGPTLVTMGGEVLDQAGVLSGGSGDPAQSILNVKRHIEELSQEGAHLQAVVQARDQEVSQLKKTIQQAEARLENLSRDYHGEEIRLVHQEKDSLHLREAQARYSQDRDRIAMEIARALEEKQELEKERTQTILALEEKLAQQQSLEKALAQNQTQWTQTSHQKERWAEELVQTRAKLAQAEERALRLASDLDRTIQTKIERNETMEKRILDIELAKHQIKELQQSQTTERNQLDQALQGIEAARNRQGELKVRYENLAKGIQGREAAVREMRRRHNEVLETRHESDLKVQAVNNQLSVLMNQIFERYKVDIATLTEPAQPEPAQPVEIDWNAEAGAITALKEKLEEMGSVHVGALEEYAELKERFDFLSQQEADLEKSLEDLKKAIQKINRVSRERFLATFDQVNVKFQEVFPRLFRGGRAKLLLVDEQNLLETGVEIYAQPPGKKLQLITLLSGGEKALTAVALIFSIFLIKPSPFCLLDEVDAPLDDANIDRFNELVREMTSQSQFIIITHNKRTMEKADCLYGVTMEEAGVSKIVSVRLHARDQEPLAAVA